MEQMLETSFASSSNVCRLLGVIVHEVTEYRVIPNAIAVPGMAHHELLGCTECSISRCDRSATDAAAPYYFRVTGRTEIMITYHQKPGKNGTQHGHR
eukprot:1218974-Rhodomonas_salina.2